jgi:hypothetical protein
MNRRVRLLTLFAAAAGLLIVGASAQAQPGINPTHYWSYHLNAPMPSTDPVTVGDQFFPQVDLPPRQLVRMMTPAWKILPDGSVFAPADTVTHYDWWEFPPIPFARSVEIDNQFGTNQQIAVSDAAFLLAPASKSLTPGTSQPPPPGTNHYLCYNAVGAGPGINVTLRDQFHSQGQLVASLTYFCVPCWKQHAGAYFPIADPATHLALYRLEIPDFPGANVWLTDQFVESAQNAVFQAPDEYLAVPSLKHEATATESRSWGRIKSTYR